MDRAYHVWSNWLASFAKAHAVHVSSDNRVDLLVDAQSFVPAMLQAIETSQSSVSYQFFGIEADHGGFPFGEGLIRAACRGVNTRVILDSVELVIRTNGHWSFLPFQPPHVRAEKLQTRRLISRMEEAGIKILQYGWRYGLNRHHTKSLICDDRIMFVGGFNPTGHNYDWHEASIVTCGPVVTDGIRNFDATFGSTNGISNRVHGGWAGIPDGVLATVALIENRPREGRFALTTFLREALHQVKESIWIQNGYIADRRIFQGLLEAKRRGVKDVVVIAPQVSNHPAIDRAFQRRIPELTRAGVHVYLLPRMTHMKVMVIDDVLVSVGSANLEAFSLRYSNEMNLVAIDPNRQLARRAMEKIFWPDCQAAGSEIRQEPLPQLMKK
jgi:cardiolipin synthase